LQLLGTLRSQQGRTAEAIDALEKAVRLDPRSAAVNFNLGVAYQGHGRLEDAARAYGAVIALDPHMAAAHNNLGNACKILGRMEPAIEAYRRALQLQPDFVEAMHNLANALRDRGAVNDAITNYEHALALDPEFADAHFNLSLALLRNGNFERGWREFEWRFAQSSGAPVRRESPFPAWRGEPLAGKTLLVWAEQGIGDEIHFASLLPELMAQGHVVVECSAKLVDLFINSFPQAEVIARTRPPHARTLARIDYQIAMGSVARWLRPALASFPPRNAYLVPVAARLDYWRNRLDAIGPGPKIGFCWRSNDLSGERALQCTDLAQWGPLFACAGVEFVCLQYDECTVELEQARAKFGVPLHDFGEVDMFDDLAETAALMRSLDVVISAPTAVSVLAGALGVPTWQMICGTYWQMHGTDRNPWHPAITVYTRARDQTWEAVMQAIATQLRALAAHVSPH
jgi:Tfp pilus assembly protein PilF